jgi:AcrR family transcriptional regulator
MSQDEERSDTDRILDTVLTLIESEGFKKVVLRDVADQARMSLATIYKYFPSRDELIVAAVERWMAENVFRPLENPVPEGSLYDKLMWIFRLIFEPWEEHPHMLDAFVRASTAVGGDRLYPQGAVVLENLGKSVFENFDPAFAEDVGNILTMVTSGAFVNYVSGRIQITDILPAIERAVYRLTEMHDPAVSSAARAATS